MNTLISAPLAPLLDRLFDEADRTTPELSAALGRMSPQERADLMSNPAHYHHLYALARNDYLAVSRETARLLYLLGRATGARSVVEFGTSFGISTLHLAAAVRDNGGGRVISTEFELSKVTVAQRNFAAAGLDDLIEVREGDALQTLSHGLPAEVDLVLLDGAKSLYPAVLALLEDHLAPRAVVVADDAHGSPEFLSTVRSSQKYFSVPFTGDVELSTYLG